MRLTIIIAWRGREELQGCIKHLLACANRFDFQIVVVNLGGSQRDCARLLPRGHPRIHVEHVAGPRWFNKPLALNIGAAAGDADVLFFSDCDILYDASVLQRMHRAVMQASDVFCTIRSITETRRGGSRKTGSIEAFGYKLFIRLRNGRQHWIDDSEEDALTGARAAPGLLMVRRSHFLRVGGYNSAFEGWGFEDQDIIARLVLGLGLRQKKLGEAIHVTHSVESRTKFYRENKQWNSRDRSFRQALRNYNDGRLRGTYEQDRQWLGTRQEQACRQRNASR